MKNSTKETKRALVIGNTNYEDGKVLRCGVNDAQDIDHKLRTIGFQVTLMCNLTYLQMMNVVMKFREGIEQNDLVVFFFSGHGIQWKNHNYLICIDNRCFVDNPDLFQFHAISVQITLELFMARKPYTTLMLLDCCRSIPPIKYHLKVETNHIVSSDEIFDPLLIKGIAGSLIVFTCGPDSSALEVSNQRNSLFTHHLLKHIDEPNIKIEDMLCRVSDGVYQDSSGQLCSHRISCLRIADIYLNKLNKDRNSVQENNNNSIVTPLFFTRWKTHVITIAGGHGQGVRFDQLHGSLGLCFDKYRETLFIADTENDRIVSWKIGNKAGEIVAGGRGAGNRLNQLNKPTDIIIDETITKSFIISDRNNRRVVRWPHQQCPFAREIESEIVIDNIDCWGLAMDQQGFLYVSDTMIHAVRRFDKGGQTGIIVAGGHGLGSGLTQFNHPTFIFIDDRNVLYVSDSNNHRVMKWTSNASEGMIIIGKNGSGCRLDQLVSPQGLWIDPYENVFVVDSGNDRVMLWRKQADTGIIVFGKLGKGNGKNQLNLPVGLSYNNQNHHLYVTDYWNDRLQCISLVPKTDRRSCNLL